MLPIGNRGLLFDPTVNVCLREAPAPAHLKGRDLLGPCQPVDGSLGDLKVVSDFLDHDDCDVDLAAPIVMRPFVDETAVNLRPRSSCRFRC